MHQQWAGVHTDCSARRVLGTALPAVSFGGRRIVFLMLPNLVLIELVEAALAASVEAPRGQLLRPRRLRLRLGMC